MNNLWMYLFHTSTIIIHIFIPTTTSTNTGTTSPNNDTTSPKNGTNDTTTLVKKCPHHKDKKRKLVWRLFAGILIFLFVVLLTILLVWAILQPKKPRFILQDATIFNFNVSAPNIFSTSIQITIYARNPNDKIGVYYDKMKTYANYHNQQITYYTQIPSVYQGHKDVNIWSPFVFSNNVPISPLNGPDLNEDQQNGGVWLDFKIDGRVKWRVGTITTGHYHLHVTCTAYVPFGNHPGDGGIFVGNNAVKYQLARRCDVSV